MNTQKKLTKGNIAEEFKKAVEKMHKMEITPITFYIDISLEDCKAMYEGVRCFPFEQIAFLDGGEIKKIVKRKDWKY